MYNRDELAARIAELEDLPADVDTFAELESLYLLRDMFYWSDEGFIDIEADGRCYPVEKACPNYP